MVDGGVCSSRGAKKEGLATTAKPSREASESTFVLCARGVAPPTRQSKQSSDHEKKACGFRNGASANSRVLDNRPAETNRVFGAQEETDLCGHENKGATAERIRCRKWPANRGGRGTSGKCSTGTGNTRRRIINKRSNIPSLVGGGASWGEADVVGDENVVGIRSGPGAQHHSR